MGAAASDEDSCAYPVLRERDGMAYPVLRERDYATYVFVGWHVPSFQYFVVTLPIGGVKILFWQQDECSYSWDASIGYPLFGRGSLATYQFMGYRLCRRPL